MARSAVLRRLGGALTCLLLALPFAAAGSEREALPFSELELVEPARHFSATQGCVEPEDEMRRNHMEYILHQRDDTVHAGVRTRQYALEECINCHASKDESGEYIRVEDSRHFCSTCHTYASVKIDCFQCHADVPVRESTLSSQSGVTSYHREQIVSGAPAGNTLQLQAAEDEPQ